MTDRGVVSNIFNQAKEIVTTAFNPIWETEKETVVEVETDSEDLTEEELDFSEKTEGRQEAPTIEPLTTSKIDIKDLSLEAAFELTRAEIVHTAEAKTKDAYRRLKEAHEQSQIAANLLQTVTSQSNPNGEFSAKDNETKRLLHRARQAGVQIVDGKHSFNKDERDSLVRNIELRNRNLETDIKLLVNEIQECIQIRNLYYQELKGIKDKEDSAKSKISQGIRS